MPERIYAKIKDDADYTRIVKLLTDYKKKIHTIKEFIESESNEDIINFSEYNTTMEKIIRLYCEDYLIQYKVCTNQYSLEELKNLLDSELYNQDEVYFFILSNISSCYSEEKDFLPWYRKIVKDYEALDNTRKIQYSNYINLKYMYCKIYINSYDFYQYDAMSWQRMLHERNYNTYQEILKYTNDKDNLANYYLEALADSIQIISHKMPPVDISLYIDFVNNDAETLEYQYKNYSFGYLKIKDLRADNYLEMREYTEYINTIIIINRYISNTFLNVYMLNSGLNYYDKCNHGMFAALVRKYLKLNENIPFMKNSIKFNLGNISDTDKKFILSDFSDLHGASQYSDNMVKLFVSAIDKWFVDDNETYKELRSIDV